MVNGYSFNTGDQAEHLPQVYQKLNAALFQNDFFLTYYNQTFTVRFYYVETVAFFSKYIGVETTCLLLFSICLFVSIYYFQKIACYFLENEMRAWFATFLLFFVIRYFTIGGNHLQDTMLTGSSFAEALSIVAFNFALRNKVYLSAFFCGVAALFQPLIALQVAAILFALLVFSKEKNRNKNSLSFSLIFALIAAFIFIPIAQRQFNISAIDAATANKILFDLRGYLHYLPQNFLIRDYLLFGLILLMSTYCLIKSQIQNKKPLFIIGISILTMCCIYSFVLILNPVSTVGKFQLYKLIVWINLFLSLPLTAFVFENKLRIKLCIVVLSLCISIKIFSNILSNNLDNNYRIYSLNKSSGKSIHEWINKNTPVESKFLVPPNDESFSCEAKRSMPVNYKAVIHEPKFLLDWKKRMEEYYSVDFTKVENRNCMNSAMQGFYNTDFSSKILKDVDFVLLNKYYGNNSYPDICLHSKSQVFYEDTNWKILKLK